jgi:macrocin-O-methyltransferase TylF-like protien
MSEFPAHFTVENVWPGFEKVRDAIDLEAGRKTFPDIKEPDFWAVYRQCRPHTLLSTERFYNLYSAVRYLAENKVPGDFVECGVMFGGASVGIAMFCERFGLRDRRHFLCDTFSGFPRTVAETDFSGRSVQMGPSPSHRGIVQALIERSGVDPARFVLVASLSRET